MVKWFILALVAAAALLLWRYSVSTNRNLPRVGQTAAEFDLPDQHGKTRSLAEFRGKWLVLYFFPRADTPG
jgi:peroxiredoxin Q/BCP